MVKLVKLATCNLNQWAMDFDLNLKNVMDSIRIAKSSGCRFRTGPELELSGYGCEDHFLEEDTTRHCWESLLAIVQSDATDNMLVDVGMPLLHKGVRYNCRVFILDRKLLLIRPKLCLANDGNYRETRWFTAWTRRELEDFPLPHSIRQATGQYSVPIGHAIVQCDDASVAIETCEELFTPDAPHVELSLAGCDIIANGSGSHHSLRKLEIRLALIRNATSKAGGGYLYANQQGCDGGRVYYDGCASAYINGEMVAQGSQFSVKDVEVVTAIMDLEEIRSFRASIASRSVQAAQGRAIPVVRANHRLCMGSAENGGYSPLWTPSAPMFPRLHTPEEEIAFGPACWLWDYLRRSGASGYFLPLSGGADSAATASMVAIMCHLVVDAIAKGDPQVLADARRVAGVKPDEAYTPTDPREFCLRILHTCYMGTSNSSAETAARAGGIAKDIGCYHLQVNIDAIVSAVLTVFSGLTGKTPKYKVHGGTPTENLALQNIQARLRMVFSYLLAQLLPWVRSKPGFLLVLGSANVDEALRGYMTKYDCSSADINPIGGIAKGDLARFLRWAAVRFPFPTLAEVVAAPPTAELEPITASYTQTDEVDMGMSYEELGIYGRLRKVYRCGPVSMYQKLVALWTKPGGTAVTTASSAENEHSHIGSPAPSASPVLSSPSAAASSSAAAAAPPRAPLTPSAVMIKVRHFFYYYSVNRHKLTTLTPSYHAENYSPEDNRFDLRPFLYNTRWTRQFETMQALATRDEQILAEQAAAASAAAAANPLALISAAPARPQPHSHSSNTVLRKFEGGEGDGLLVHKGASQL